MTQSTSGSFAINYSASPAFRLKKKKKMNVFGFFVCFLVYLSGEAYGDAQEKSAPSRILGGKAISITKAPYQVSLRILVEIKPSMKTLHICGGSYVSAGIVLTAAHCTYHYDYRSLFVLLGSDYSWYDSSFGSGELVHVMEKHEHKDWNNVTAAWDAAVLILSRTLVENDRIRTIELSRTEVHTSYSLFISGWGATKENGTIWPNLMATNVSVYDWNICRLIYSRVRDVTDQMFCAGGDGVHDSCQGDSGGPAVYQGSLVGVVSWGSGCGHKNIPGVYTRVSSIYTWVESFYSRAVKSTSP